MKELDKFKKETGIEDPQMDQMIESFANPYKFGFPEGTSTTTTAASSDAKEPKFHLDEMLKALEDLDEKFKDYKFQDPYKDSRFSFRPGRPGYNVYWDTGIDAGDFSRKWDPSNFVEQWWETAVSREEFFDAEWRYADEKPKMLPPHEEEEDA
jgi:hypothetical protein